MKEIQPWICFHTPIYRIHCMNSTTKDLWSVGAVGEGYFDVGISIRQAGFSNNHGTHAKENVVNWLL